MYRNWISVMYLLLIYMKWGSAFDKHQFHFGSGNVAYGGVPRQVHITGFWYIHPQNAKFKHLFRMNYTSEDLMGNLYVCKTNVEAKLLQANSQTTRQAQVQRIHQLNQGRTVGLASIQPFIDVRDCEMLTPNDAIVEDDKDFRVKEFHIHHMFEKHGPLLFVDAWGIAAYHYRAKHTDAQRITHCENDDAQFPVIFNKRPICPRPSLKSTIVDSGKLTIYKPNIESVQKRAYRCYVEYTYIETKQDFMGAYVDNLPLGKAVKPVDDPELCRSWITKQECDLRDMTFTYLANFNKNFTFFTSTRMATKNNIELYYEWMYLMQYTIANCIVDIGYIRATPPFKTMLTSWGYIANDYLYKSHYQQSGGEMIVWDPFVKTDICSYVPISSIDASRVTYNSKDFLDQDPHPNATEMYHFVSDADKSVYTSDNTQIVIEEFNCVSNEMDQTLYAINNGMLVVFEKGGSIYEDDDEISVDKGQTIYHPHYAYNELTVIETDDGEDNELQAKTVGDQTNAGGECEIGGCRHTYARHTLSSGNVSSSNFKTLKQKMKPPKNLNVSKSTPLFATVQYLQYKLEEYQNEEVVRRAQAWCENQQHLYDIQLLVARLSPSAVISSYLNRPVSANSIGNGVFITHYCQVIREYIVVENLFINNTDLVPHMANKTFLELYKAAGVSVDRNFCFTMPIVIFKDSNNQYRLGQINHDQSVSTISLPWIEECKFGRYSVHVIGNEVYVFSNYARLSVTTIEDLYDHSTRLKQNTIHLEKLSNGTATKRNEIEPFLESTQFVDIYTKYEPKEMDAIITGFVDTEIYGYRENLRMISSFEDLLNHVNKARLDDRRLDMATQGVVHDHITSFGKGFKVLVNDIADGANYVFDTIGGGVIGNIIGKTGGVLGGVADFFTGPVMDFIIVIAAIVVGAGVFYMFVKHKLLATANEKGNVYQPQPYFQPPPYAAIAPSDVRKRHTEHVDF